MAESRATKRREQSAPVTFLPLHAAAIAVLTDLLQTHRSRCKEGTSLLLTAAGELYVGEQLLRGQPQQRPAARRLKAGRITIPPPALPFWDGKDRLWLGGVLIKVFHQLAPYQKAILDACQELDWQLDPIDDPLPRKHEE